MMKRVFFFSFFCLLCAWTSIAQVRGNEIRVLVSPDHTDWMYRLNEKCTFTVRVLKAQNLLSDVKIDYEEGAVSGFRDNLSRRSEVPGYNENSPFFPL